MNRPCSTEKETISFDLATKLESTGNPHGARATSTRSRRRRTTQFRSTSNGIGATGLVDDSRISFTGTRLCRVTQHLRDNCQRSARAAQLSREELEELTHQLTMSANRSVRKTCHRLHQKTAKRTNSGCCRRQPGHRADRVVKA